MIKFHWEKASQKLQWKSVIIYTCYISHVATMLWNKDGATGHRQWPDHISMHTYMEWYDARVDLFCHAPENGVSLGCLSALQPCPWWRPGQTLCQWHHATLPLLPRFLGQVGLPLSDHHTSAKKMSVSLHFAIPIKVFPSRDIEPLSPLFGGIECVTFSLFLEVLCGTCHVTTKTVL